MDPILQLADDILLITTLVRRKNNLLTRHLQAVRRVKIKFQETLGFRVHVPTDLGVESERVPGQANKDKKQDRRSPNDQSTLDGARIHPPCSTVFHCQASRTA